MPLVDLQLFQTEVSCLDAVDTLADRLEAARQQGWAQGYDAGLAAALAELGASQVKIEQRLCENILALHSGLEVCRRQCLDDLKPVLTDLASYLLPRMAKSVLAPQLLDVLSGPIARWLTAPLVIAAHPDSIASLQRAVAHVAHAGITWCGEDAFSPTQIELRQGDKLRRLDLDAAVQQMIFVLETYFDIDLLEQEYATTNRG